MSALPAFSNLRDLIPLQQGLRQLIVKTTITELRDLIPLQQGLRHLRNAQEAQNELRDLIPLQQGLKPSLPVL